MTIYLLLILICLIAIHITLRYNKMARSINKIPGPMVLPLLGNMLQVNKSAEKVWLLLRKFAKIYYPIYKLWFIKNAMVFIQHPDDLKILLSSKVNINKSSAYENLEFVAKSGLIVSRDDKWRQRRKLVSPAFSLTMMKINLGIVNEHGKKLVSHIQSLGDETVQSLVPLFTKLTMGIICETALGVNVHKSGTEGEEKFRHALDLVLEITLYRSIRPYIKDWMMEFLPIGKKQEHDVAEAHIFRDKVIEERRKYHDNKGFVSYATFADDDAADSALKGNRALPLLDLLLSAEKDGLIDSDGVGEEVDTFIAAGYDTVALALCYTLMLLAENKESQDLARSEVLEIYKQCNGKLTITEIQMLDYLDRCIKESLRLFPIIPHIGRNVDEGQQLHNYYIPPKSEAIFCIYDVHRDPNFWPEPEKFDPDRFLPDKAQERHPFAYIPFSAGVRSCIGQKFAMIALKSLITQILCNFYLEPIDKTINTVFSMHVALQPVNPIHVKFVKIKD